MWCCDGKNKGTGSRNRWDNPPYRLLACLVALGTGLDFDGVGPLALGSQPFSPEYSRLRLLVQQYDDRDHRNRGCYRGLRRPENPVGWLLCLNGLTTSISHFSSQYAIYALLARPDSLPAGEAFAWIDTWILSILIALDVFTFLLFPTGKLPSRRWRWLGWLTVAFVFVGAISGAFTSGPVDGLGSIRNPLGIEGFTSGYKAVLYPMAPFLFAASALSVSVRLRRATGVERQQIKWFAYAAVVMAITVFLQIVTEAVDTPVWFERTEFAVFTVAGTAVPISIGIAILRYRLYDIDVIINRTLVYGALTVLLAAGYVATIMAFKGSAT